MRGVADAERDSDEKMAVDAVVDGGDGGCPRGATFCQTQCPLPDFCDDFEGAQASSFDRWVGVGDYVNPIQIEAGRTGIVVDDAGARSSVLASIAVRPTVDRVFAGLVHSIFDAGPDARGVRVQFTGTMRTLDFVPDASQTARSAYMFAVGDLVENQGVTVVFKEKGASKLDIIVQRRPLIDDGEIVDLVALGGVGKDELANSRPSFELEIAPRDLLLARQHACPESADSDGGEPLPPNGMWLWVKIYVEKCLPLRGAIASPDWLNRLTLVGGVFVSPYGEGESRLDDIALTYLR